MADLSVVYPRGTPEVNIYTKFVDNPIRYVNTDLIEVKDYVLRTCMSTTSLVACLSLDSEVIYTAQAQAKPVNLVSEESTLCTDVLTALNQSTHCVS